MFLICLVEYQHLWGGGERDNREGEGGICRDEWRPNTVQQLPGSWRIKIKAGGCRVMNVNLCTEIPGEVSIILQKTNLDLMATENLLLGHDQIEFTRCGHTKGWEQDGKHSLPSLPVGTSRPAALPRMSPRFSDSLYIYMSETAGCYAEVWGTEKLTGKQTSRGTMNEQMFKTVRKKGTEQRTYVPSTSGSKEKGEEEEGWGEGWVGEGQKRQDEERDRRLDQTQAAEI